MKAGKARARRDDGGRISTLSPTARAALDRTAAARAKLDQIAGTARAKRDRAQDVSTTKNGP